MLTSGGGSTGGVGHPLLLGVLDDQAGYQEAEPLAYVVQHLADGGGGHPLVRGEPGSGHGRGGGGHDYAGDAIEDGGEVAEDGEALLGQGGIDEEHAAQGRAKGHQAAGEQDGGPEVDVLEVQHRHHEDQEGDAAPVSEQRDSFL